MKGSINAGSWKVDITPPLGISIVGTFVDKHAEKIMDQLYSNSIVIDDGKKEIAIVSIDVCVIPDNVFKEIINKIEDTCGINKNNIIIAATHTHSGPSLGELFIDLGEVWPEYIEIFIRSVAKSVIMAQRRKKPVRVGVGKGKNDKFLFNRRLKKPDGSIIMNFVEKDELQDCTTNGRIDPEVIFVVFENEDKKPVAIIVNYSNHNNTITSSNLISSDFAGYLAKTLAGEYGEDVVTLFLPGACGDVNWIDYKDLSQKSGPELAEEIGISLAGTVLENIYNMEYPTVKTIEAKYKKLKIPDRPFCDRDTKEDLTFGNDESTKKTFELYRNESAFAQGKELPINEIDIHVVYIGEDIAIVTNPGELFTSCGLKIKDRSPIKHTLISELTNGYAGYICSPDAFLEGGYETRKTNKSSHLEIGAENKIVKASLELLYRKG